VEKRKVCKATKINKSIMQQSRQLQIRVYLSGIDLEPMCYYTLQRAKHQTPPLWSWRSSTLRNLWLCDNC